MSSWPKTFTIIGTALVITCAAQADDPTPFTTILRTHWHDWAGEKELITPERLDHLMKERKIKGDDAAVLAALKRMLRDPDTKQLLTLDMKRIDQYEEQAAQPHTKKSYDKAFKKAQSLIQADPHALFAEGAPHLSSIHQARSGDCWLLSTIGAMIHEHHGKIAKLITDEGDNKYAVRFAYHTLTVKAPTDAEIGAYTSDKSDGDWLYVLENAMGQYREEFNQLHKVKEANDDALVGGNGAVAFHDILGKASNTIKMTPQKPEHDQIREALAHAFKTKHLVIAGTTHDKTIILPHGIAHAHCMAVIGWDAATDQVAIWNPWGNHAEPKESEGENAGYHTVDGKFSMPLKDFTRSFAYINVETNKPYKPEPKKKN